MARREPRLAFGVACSLGLHLAVPIAALVASQLVSGFQSRPSPTATRLPEARVALDLKPTGGLAERTTRADGIPGVPMRISLVELPAQVRTPPVAEVDPKPAIRRQVKASATPPPQRLSQVQLRRAPDRDGILVAIASPPLSPPPRPPELERVQPASTQQHAGEARPAQPSVETAAQPQDAQAQVALPPGSGAGHDQGPGGISGRDPNQLLVAERVAHVATLFVGAGAIRQHGRREAHLRFRIDSNGYVQDYELKQATHVHVFDDSIEVILHLAEPFPVAERAYEINLPFAVE